jgi:hypothetical protein
MKNLRTAAIVLGTLLTVPAMGFAAPARQSSTPAKTKTTATAPAAVATHATKGTITSMDATSLVVTHSASGKAKPMTFVLNADTQRKGSLAVGSKVEVRYRAEGKSNVATAVSEQTEAPAAAVKTTKKK